MIRKFQGGEVPQRKLYEARLVFPRTIYKKFQEVTHPPPLPPPPSTSLTSSPSTMVSLTPFKQESKLNTNNLTGFVLSLINLLCTFLRKQGPSL